MSLYRFAGLTVEMEPRFEHLSSYAEKYRCFEEGAVADIKVGHTDAFLEEKQKESPHLSLSDCEYIYSGASFAGAIIKKGGFVLHSSAVEYEGSAYLFSANSGTGKSTHTAFWQEVFGKENTTLINDDKPAVRQKDGVYCAFGTPFSGKSCMNENVAFPIKALCFIHRSMKNEIKRLSPSESLPLIVEQTLRPKSEENIFYLFETLDGFLKNVPVYSLGVTYSPESALFAYRAINGK